MKKKHGWEDFFDWHAPQYMENCFVQATLAEVDFLLDVLDIPDVGSILDIGCGTGRHSVELAKRGYKMTGVDISAGMLAQAEAAAAQAGVEVEFIHADATKFRSDKLFDAAICLCEGAFNLSDLDENPIEHDEAILRNISSALKPGAGFLLTTLNGFKKIREHTQEDVDSGRFDPFMLTTMMEEIDLPVGKKQVRLKEKGYLPQELDRLLRQCGFEVKHIWGGTAGNWGRRSVKLDEFEIMVVAGKE